MDVLIPIVLVVAAAAILAVRLRRRSSPVTRAAYWVYSTGGDLPETQPVMDRMMRGSPWPDRIGRREGLLFSDIRLTVSSVSRQDNPHVFRPDLLELTDRATPALLAQLASCHFMVKVEFASPTAIEDNLHLVFVAHMAFAYASLLSASLVLDEVNGDCHTLRAMREWIDQNPDLDSAAVQVRTRFHRGTDTGVVRTRGLGKAGLRELVSLPVPLDQENLATEMIERLAEYYWNKRELEPTVELRNELDLFLLQTKVSRGDEVSVRILRVVPDS